MNRDDNFPNMDPLEIHSGPDVPKRLLEGVRKTAEFVGVTFGPNGGYAAFKSPHQKGRGTKDGATAAKMLGGGFIDPVESFAADFVMQASAQTNQDAGDGTTVSALLTEHIARHGFEALANGSDSNKLGKGIKKAIERCVEAVRSMSIPADARILRDVVLTSMNGDTDVAAIISEAMEVVGPEGSVKVEGTREKTTRLDFDQQFYAPMGYLHPAFVNMGKIDACAMACPLVLLTDATLEKGNDLKPFVQYAANMGRPLLVVAGNVKGDAMNILVTNMAASITTEGKNGILACAIQTPGSGHDAIEWLNDLAAYTGAKIAMKGNSGGSLETAMKDPAGWLGSAQEAVVKSDSISIKRGPDDIEAQESEWHRQMAKCFKDAGKRVPERVAMLKALAAAEGTSLQERERLEARVTMLDKGRATIYVGTGGVAETQALKDLIEDGIRATRCAAEEGILPGGGIALLRVLGMVENQIPDGIHKDEQSGWHIVLNMLSAPIRRLAESAGMDAEALVGGLIGKPANHGFDFRNEVEGDMIEMGVIDTAKVMTRALQNSASAAVTLLQTRQVATPIINGHRIA